MYILFMNSLEFPRRTFIKFVGLTVGEIVLSKFGSKSTQANTPAEVSTQTLPPASLTSTFLMYHEMDYSHFKQDLLRLIAEGQQPISPQTAISVISGLTTLPPNLRTFIVSCDDSLASQYEPILKATEEIKKETGLFVPVIICAITKLNDPAGPVNELPLDTPLYNDHFHNYLNLSQSIDLIQAGHIFGNHTVNHGRLPTLEEGARNGEIETAEERIEAIYQMAKVDRPLKIFAYPEGAYTNQLAYIAQLNFDLAFSTEPNIVHTPYTKLHAGRIKMS